MPGSPSTTPNFMRVSLPGGLVIGARMLGGVRVGPGVEGGV